MARRNQNELTRLDHTSRRLPYNTIGGAIRHFRKKRGWTQTQLAEKIGVTQGNIAHYEADRVTPPVKKIKDLAIIFECPFQLLAEHRWSPL